MSDSKIQIRCGKCGRTKRVNREPYEPPHAAVAEFDCDRHESGGKDTPTYYFDADGNEIDWGEWMRNVEKQKGGAA